MTNINKNISIRSKAYTPDEIAEVMELLRLNNFNISQTCKITGVSRVTIGKWRDKYQSRCNSENRDEQFDEQVKERSITYRAQV